jgi:hypothetical protein
LEVVGSPTGDDAAARLAPYLAAADHAQPAIADGVKRKRLGRSLRDVEAGEPT